MDHFDNDWHVLSYFVQASTHCRELRSHAPRRVREVPADGPIRCAVGLPASSSGARRIAGGAGESFKKQIKTRICTAFTHFWLLLGAGGAGETLKNHAVF